MNIYSCYFITVITNPDFPHVDPRYPEEGGYIQGTKEDIKKRLVEWQCIEPEYDDTIRMLSDIIDDLCNKADAQEYGAYKSCGDEEVVLIMKDVVSEKDMITHVECNWEKYEQPQTLPV